MASSSSVATAVSSSIRCFRRPLHPAKTLSDVDLLFHRLSPPLFTSSRHRSPLRASKRFPSSSYPQGAVVVVPDPRAWVGDLGIDGDDDDDDDDEEEEEEEEDRSLDLLVRFLHNIFRKISRRARKAVRSVLPPFVSSKLVKFSVNGVLILAFLWILKAFLEVVCTFGSMVFVSILLVRGIWSGVSYISENQYIYASRLDNDDNRWSGAQTA